MAVAKTPGAYWERLGVINGTSQSWCGWFRSDVIPALSDFEAVLAQDAGANDWMGVYLTGLGGGDAVLEFWANNLSNAIITGPTVSAGEWIFVAAVRSGTGTSWRLAWRREGESALTTATGNATGVIGTVMKIGAENGGGFPGAGSFAFWRVFPAALTDPQLLAESASATAVATEWADWPIATTADDTDDVSGNARPLTFTAAGGAQSNTTGPLIDLPVTGTLAAVAPAFTGTLAGTVDVSGALAGSAPAFTGSFTGSVGDDVSGVLAGTAPAFTGSFTGTVASGDVSGALAAVAPAFTGSFSGLVTVPPLPPSPPVVFAPTTQQLLDMDGVRIRADRFEFDLLQGDDVIGQLHPNMDRPPVVKVNARSLIKRTLDSLYLPASEVLDVNPLLHRVRVRMVLQNGFSESLGLFMWADDSQPREPWGVERASTMVDETHRLDQGQSFAASWLKGTSVIIIAVHIAQQVLPSDRIVFDTTSAVSLGAPVGYPSGTSRLRMLTDMMEKLGFLPPFMDRHGVLHLVDAPDLSAEPPVCTYLDGTRIFAGTINEWNSLLETPNRFNVYESSGQGTTWHGRYDLPDEAPNSIANRGGVVITDSEAIPGLGSQTQADKAARTRAQVTGRAYRYASFAGPVDPRHDIFSAVGYRDMFTWLEEEWQATCRPGGTHTHAIRRSY